MMQLNGRYVCIFQTNKNQYKVDCVKCKHKDLFSIRMHIALFSRTRILYYFRQHCARGTWCSQIRDRFLFTSPRPAKRGNTLHLETFQKTLWRDAILLRRIRSLERVATLDFRAVQTWESSARVGRHFFGTCRGPSCIPSHRICRNLLFSMFQINRKIFFLYSA